MIWQAKRYEPEDKQASGLAAVYHESDREALRIICPALYQAHEICRVLNLLRIPPGAFAKAQIWL